MRETYVLAQQARSSLYITMYKQSHLVYIYIQMYTEIFYIFLFIVFMRFFSLMHNYN